MRRTPLDHSQEFFLFVLGNELPRRRDDPVHLEQQIGHSPLAGVLRYAGLYGALWRNSVTREMSFKLNFVLWILVEFLWFALQLAFMSYLTSVNSVPYNQQGYNALRVVALDPRGQGDSQVPRAGYHIDRRADDIAECLATRTRGPVILVGWSLAAVEVLLNTRHIAELIDWAEGGPNPL